MSVRIHGKYYSVVNGKLDLRKKGITSIAEIEGLESVLNLLEIDLRDNQIAKLEGLDKVPTLQRLDLRDNPLERWLKTQIGAQTHDAQALAKWAKEYCQNPALTENSSSPRKVKETQRLAKLRELRQVQETQRLDKLKKLVQVSKRLRIEQIASILKMRQLELLDRLVDWAAEFGFKIDRDEVDFEGGHKDEFITTLEREFVTWGKGEKV